MQTPYIFLNYQKLIKNIKDMANLAKEVNIDMRPHCKSHKTVEIAKLQIKFGASGITTSTLKEVEMLIEGGIDSITLAYPLIGKAKIDRYLNFKKDLDLRTIVLDYEHAKYLNKYFSKDNPLIAYLKVDCGFKRLGVKPEEVAEVVKAINNLENIVLIGLLTHGGQSYSGKSTLSNIANLEAAAVTSHNLKSLIVSCGSTPTAKELLKIKGVDEIRPGNYVFYDNTMIKLGVCNVDDCALYIKSTIIAIYSDYMVIDAGSKSLSSDKGVHGNSTIEGFGLILEDSNLIIDRLSEEHGIIIGHKHSDFKVGDVLTIIPNHACTAINLFDEINVFNDDNLIDIYKVKGRGH